MAPSSIIISGLWNSYHVNTMWTMWVTVCTVFQSKTAYWFVACHVGRHMRFRLRDSQDITGRSKIAMHHNQVFEVLQKEGVILTFASVLQQNSASAVGIFGVPKGWFLFRTWHVFCPRKPIPRSSNALRHRETAPFGINPCSLAPMGLFHPKTAGSKYRPPVLKYSLITRAQHIAVEVSIIQRGVWKPLQLLQPRSRPLFLALLHHRS